MEGARAKETLERLQERVDVLAVMIVQTATSAIVHSAGMSEEDKVFYVSLLKAVGPATDLVEASEKEPLAFVRFRTSKKEILVRQGPEYTMVIVQDPHTAEDALLPPAKGGIQIGAE